jgi:L-asparaginase
VGPAGYRGLVIEGAGGGHVTAVSVAELARLAEVMPVVLASRTGAGPALRRTYSFPGSEIDLLGNGLIPAGALTGAKARMLLRLLLAAGASGKEVREAFDALATPGVQASLLGGRFTVDT